MNAPHLHLRAHEDRGALCSMFVDLGNKIIKINCYGRPKLGDTIAVKLPTGKITYQEYVGQNHIGVVVELAQYRANPPP